MSTPNSHSPFAPPSSGHPAVPTASSGSAQPAPVQPSTPTSNPTYRERKPLPPPTTNEVDLVIMLGDVNRSNDSTREFLTLVKSKNGKEFLIYGKDKPFSIPAYLVHKMCAGEISSLTGSNNKGGIHIKLENKYIRYFSISEKTYHKQLAGYAINQEPTAYTEPNVNVAILLSTRDGETKTNKKQFVSIAPNPKNLHPQAELLLTNIKMSVFRPRKNRNEIETEQLSTPAVEIGSKVVATRDAEIICNFDLTTKCTPYYEITYTP